jgi:mono/diheme cytochrome c family protein
MKKLLPLMLLAACRGQLSEDPPVHPVRNMFTQARLDPMEKNDFFTDHRAMRPLPEGVVAFGAAKEDDAFYRGGEPVTQRYKEIPTAKPAGVTYVRNPLSIDADLMKTGQRRYATYCTPCHGPLGDGKGMVAQHGFVGIADLHQDRIVKMQDGEIFSTITNGLRNMPSYSSQIDEHDRWATIAYVRALQRSQHTTLADVPEDKRSALDAGDAKTEKK